MSFFVVAGLMLAVIAVVFVLYPVIQPKRLASHTGSTAELAERRHNLYRQILDIEFDQRLGKIDPVDARELSQKLLRHAAELFSRESMTDSQAEAEIEREILAIRRGLPASGEWRAQQAALAAIEKS